MTLMDLEKANELKDRISFLTVFIQKMQLHDNYFNESHRIKYPIQQEDREFLITSAKSRRANLKRQLARL
jgi:hypothetical protein